LGETVCHYHQRKAAQRWNESAGRSWAWELERVKKEHAGRPELIEDALKQARKKHDETFPPLPKGMEYLKGDNAADYFTDMIFVQQYASMNRRLMQGIILREAFDGALPVKEIESVHNYIDFQDLIIRKGAIRSYSGEFSVIPFNMRDGLLICQGLSNADWNFSAPHGAGRLMSRGQARRRLSLGEMHREMKKAGVYTTSIARGTLDEAAGAYKPARFIEKAIAPTARIVEKVRPVLNVKDAGNLYKSKQRKTKKRK
jgi:RNA-splicing ligase RtcB